MNAPAPWKIFKLPKWERAGKSRVQCALGIDPNMSQDNNASQMDQSTSEMLSICLSELGASGKESVKQSCASLGFLTWSFCCLDLVMVL